ncbi:rab3 GTPase-activating protein catalytic subunit isoform X2 [Cryptotermes secundus]|uniref:rab3 GTPase-activating protein catalytic subunit isoform X2 n=1 Tax=Cryptotermes secundus TaxID=105785 RepID=UPI000CD7B478|nr:rab3 GTPase-activating protein catalytic subunit isoform X2 [Cryptotermes secundus]
MNEEIDDQDFYQHDFTTATDWEIFIAHLEKIIQEWKIPKVKIGPQLKRGELSEGEWKRTSENISFADFEFIITRYNLRLKPLEGVTSPVEEEIDEGRTQVQDDMMSLDNDFPPQRECDFGDGSSHPHPLVRWYGLRDFVIVSPARCTISDESRVKILLSSVYIAINNSNCQVPVFVQIHEPQQHYYMGVCEGKGIRFEFEMVHLKRTPPHCKYLTGLLNLFKSKVPSPLSLEPVSVAVRFTYVLRDWTSNNTWTQEPPDFDILQGESLGVAELGKLPFGATFDPISELHLFATWPHLMENVVVDSESYSDFEPSQAPQWAVRVKMAEQPACLLNEYFSEFIQLCSNNISMQDLLGDLVHKGTSVDTNLSTPLNLLTESRVPTISKVIEKAKGQRQVYATKGPITDSQLMPILYFLFPDAEDEPENPYMEPLSNYASCDNQQLEELSTGLKSAPVDGLIWRLAVVMSHVVHALGDIRAAAHLWYEFTQEMRYRWENGITIPGVPPGVPDQRTCLLHQKLQMLNCCIMRKQIRELAARTCLVEGEDCESDSEDEEFFDCSAEEPEGDMKEKRRGSKHRHKHSLWNQPVGRLSKHGNLRLLNTGEHLYIPVTQEPSLKTEDQVEEDAQVLLQLGTDAQGAEMRARMMSASLLSDMESFKAANPGSILEDFIRWYSPRDWIEEGEVDEYGQRKGSLSARMQIKGNMWLEVWEAAKPVPARRQKRLFDDTREAQKVLHFLESQKPSAVAQLLLPVLTHAAICRLLQEQKEDLSMLSESFRQIIKTAERITRNPRPTLQQYDELALQVAEVEEVIAQANSLEVKFSLAPETVETPELRAFLLKLMHLSEVDVPGGPRGAIGSRIRTMFSDAQKMVSDMEPLNLAEETPWSINSSNFPQPSIREFVMRVWATRPAPSSRLTPQRLTAILKKKEFRLAGCFCHDTTFQ